MYKTLATLGGAIMAASAFAPWVAGPFGQTGIPWEIFRAFYERVGMGMDIEPMLFFSTFAVAALVAILAILGAAPRLLTLLAGLYPPGLLGVAYWRGSDQIEALGLPLPGGADLQTIWTQVQPLLAIGVWLYLGGMIALILAGLAGRGDR